MNNKKLVYIFKRINKQDNYIIDTDQFKTNKTAKKRGKNENKYFY